MIFLVKKNPNNKMLDKYMKYLSKHKFSLPIRSLSEYWTVDQSNTLYVSKNDTIVAILLRAKPFFSIKLTRLFNPFNFVGYEVSNNKITYHAYLVDNDDGKFEILQSVGLSHEEFIEIGMPVMKKIKAISNKTKLVKKLSRI